MRPDTKGAGMYKSIVVGTDGSGTASEAVRHAITLARLSGAVLHVVTAYTNAQAASAVAMTSGAMAGVAVDSGALDDDLQANATEVLARALPDELTEGIQVTRHARPGAASDILVDVAEEEKADLIVVGNRGMT